MSAGTYTKRIPSIDLNLLSVALISGLIAGLVAGAGSRIAMRFVAIAGSIETDLTIGGTLFILVLGAVLGIIFALPFFFLQRFIPLATRWASTLYGLILALIFVVPPFLLAPEGELGFVSPALGIALFAPLALLYGIVLGEAAVRLEARYRDAPQQRIGFAWLALFGLALFVLISNAAALMSETLPFPQVASDVFRGAGVGIVAAHDLHGAFVLLLILAYGAAAAAIFWQGGKHGMARFTALALLFFAAAFFNNGTSFLTMGRAFPPARLLPGFLRAVGFLALMLFLYLFPDGRFTPKWTRPMTVVLGVVALLWFLNPFSGSMLDATLWPEPLQYLLFMAALGTGVAVQVVRHLREDDEARRRPHRWSLLGIAAVVFAFGLLWAAMLVAPELKGRVAPRLAVQAPFAFGPYLLVWLLLPVSIAIAAIRYNLWPED
jgi:hypothetical protein